MDHKRIIVVLGMHRSGTSSITRALQVLGVELGDHLIAPAAGINDKGFWEDVDVNDLNIRLLATLGHDWDTLRPVKPNEFEAPHVAAFRLSAIELIRKKLEFGDIFGIKDPRMARMLPFWLDVFSHLGVKPSFVICVRNPLSIVSSLAKRNHKEAEKTYQLWLDHMVESVRETDDQQRVFVDFDALMASPLAQLENMAKGLQLPFDPNSAACKEYCTNFLDPALRHTAFTLEDLDIETRCGPIVREFYKVLREIAAAQDVRSDQLSQVMKKATEFLAEADSLLGLTDTLSQRLIDEQSNAARLQAAIAELQANTGALQNALEAAGERHDSFLDILKGLEQQLSERERHLSDKERHIQNLDAQFNAHRHRLQAIETSTSWRLTYPVRRALITARATCKAGLLLPAIIRRGGGPRETLRKAIRVFRNDGLQGVIRRIQWMKNNSGSEYVGQEVRRVSDRHDYETWVNYYNTLDETARGKIKDHIEEFVSNPVISIIMPVYNPPLEFLKAAIDSITAQLYSHWELCIADDASTNPAVVEYLRQVVGQDPRIKVIHRETNGHISAASNSALELATGQFIALMDNDDLLSEDALYWVAVAILEHPHAGIIYSDEDKIDGKGKRTTPYFKSRWNKYLFRSQNMICHLGVYRHELVQQVGGFRTGFEGAQDYDLALRCCEAISETAIIHIPRVLYHWRAHDGSTALAGEEKPYAALAGVRALDEHLQRTHCDGHTELLPFGMYRVHYALPSDPPLVSLVIPTKNAHALVKQCIDSIINKTTYPAFEIILVDNGSDENESLAYFETLKSIPNVTVVRDDGPFNYSAINNRAVELANGEIIGLVNNDIEVISPDWLSEMVSIALQPGVGAVGARLWYPDDRLQHGGVIVGVGGVAGHSHKYLAKGDVGYFGRAGLIQELSAVTAACLIIKKSTFNQVKGLDEVNLSVAFNDVDFCLRVQEAGYVNVWTPFAELYHHESATRGVEDTSAKKHRFMTEVLYMQARWPNICSDYAYNPNLTLEHEDFGLAWPPRL